MKRGFTIIELLVASMLLGMLVTILTMIFNQSSISWRIGVASVSDMDTIRDKMAELRDEADNAFAYGGQIYRSVGLWDEDGELRDRACDAMGSAVANEDSGRYRATLLRLGSENGGLDPNNLIRTISRINVGTEDSSAGSAKSYVVNVMSGGPNNDINDWQAIWSFPDDPSEW